MPTSLSRKPAATFAQQALALASSAWTELGVSGWTTTHGDWAIDPEPLMLFTAWLGDRDPRLRDEATDWCVRNWRYVSRTRLKNLLRVQPADVQEAWGEFAATIEQHAGVNWPGATTPRRYTVIGRSTMPPLERPALIWIRLRAMFGVGARAEILRCFLAADGNGGMSVARLAIAAGFTKRNVADECDTLERSGVLSVRSSGNRFSYSLARRAELEAFVGELPAIRPNWSAMLTVARELVTLEDAAKNLSLRTLPVRVRKTLRLIDDDLAELDIDRSFDNVPGPDLWGTVHELAMVNLGAWSLGRWPSQNVAAAPGRRLPPART